MSNYINKLEQHMAESSWKEQSTLNR